jgi:hypothetical protein
MKLDTTVKVLLLLIVILLGTIACQNLLPTSAAKESPQVIIAEGYGFCVYYPDEKTLYRYLHSGGSMKCEWKYTLSTPGGPITQTKCQ